MSFENLRVGYLVGQQLKVCLTDRLVTKYSPFKLQGSNFQLPWVESPPVEPTVEQIITHVNNIYDSGYDEDNDGHTKSALGVIFGGDGEQLLRIDALCEISSTLKEKRHGIPLRVETLGLLPMDEAEATATRLKSNGITHATVMLLAGNPVLYKSLLQPKDPQLGLGNVLNFMEALVHSGIRVTGSTIDRPDVDVSSVEQLSQAMGAVNFKILPYYP